ncbi:hypothetical protein CWO07_26005 [Vibrio splendidus]|uniref:Uncharacterized protein n=1 Tax=Vibrio splendidus TaxID=29497 RepID=A0A2T5EAK2_VIBSP|nr:hypothetical protein CWO07_26005 [Vibrio splendidus]
MFFPAATPPYGVFTYTGDSCDGSESSGGETGGGETGGGSTGGGSTGGGSTGGGSTGGGSTGGGSMGGDGLTKAQLQDALKSFFGKSGSFNAPDQGDGYATSTESKVKESPLKLGQMSFSDGSYESTAFSLSRWNVDVGFNLFSSLGSNNTNMIRTVILFIATLLAGFILLSSGRSKV